MRQRALVPPRASFSHADLAPVTRDSGRRQFVGTLLGLLPALLAGAVGCAKVVGAPTTLRVRSGARSSSASPGGADSRPVREVSPEAYYLALLSELSVLAGQPATALERVQQAATEDPESVWLRLREADLELFLGREGRARTVLRRVCRSRPRRGEGWLALATLEARHDPGRALGLVRRALSVSPNLMEARLLMARLLRRLGRFTRASHALRGILSDHPEHPGALAALGYLALQRGQVTEAKTWFARWAQASPFQVAPWRQVARTAVLRGDLRGAEDALLEGLTATDDDLGLAHELLRLWRLTGRRDRAADLVTLVGAHENGPYILFGAEVLLRLGRLAQARGWLAKAAALDPEAAGRAQLRARWLWRCGRRRAACDLLRAVSQTHSAYGWAQSRLASYREVLVGPHRALEGIRSAIRQRPRDPLLWQDLAERLARAGKRAASLRALGRSRALRAQSWLDVGVRYERAMLAAEAGDLSGAWKEMAGLVTDAPDDPAVLNLAGYSLLERGIDLSRAEELLERAYRLAPLDPYLLDSLGWLRYKQGRLAAAARWLERATRIDPWLSAAWRHLGRVQIARGRLDPARRALAAALESASSRSERSVAVGLLERLGSRAPGPVLRWRCPRRPASSPRTKQSGTP